jgi:predicted TPR repeat methyltransferase
MTNAGIGAEEKHELNDGLEAKSGQEGSEWTAPTIANQGTDADENRKLYDDWGEKYEQDVRAWGYDMPEKVAALVKKHIASGSEGSLSVVDAGAGDGLSGKALVEEGFETITGFDLSPELVELARKRGLYKAVDVVDLSKPLQYSDGQFDVATVVGVMTYLEPEPDALEELCRVVKPGGLVCFTHRTDKVDAWIPAQKRLETEDRWTPVELTPALPYLPLNPDYADRIKVTIHLYRVVCETL